MEGSESLLPQVGGVKIEQVGGSLSIVQEGGSESLLPQVGGVEIQQVGGGLSTVQQGGSESLLPQAGGVTITPVQGGGGKCLSGKCKPYGWYSMPLLLPVSVQGVPTAQAKDMKALRKFWDIRSDSDVLVANIDILKSTVYIVAPLRGDVTATNDILSWAFSIVVDPNSYIVFNGSLRAGGSEKDGDTIEGMLCYLMSRYPGQVLCVGCEDSGASVCSIDGIILHALPHTSRRLFLGSIPSPRSIDESHEKEMGGIRFEIMEVDTRFKKQHTDDMFSLTFKKPTALYNRDKEPKSQDIRADKVWGAPPGWVTRIEFQTRDPVQKGGRGGGGGRSVSGPDQGYSKEYIKMQEAMKTAKPCNPDEDWNCPPESPGAQRWMREEGARQAKQMKEMMQLTDPAYLLGSAFKTLKSFTKPKVPTPPEVPSPPHVPGTAEPLEKQLCEAITKIIHEHKEESKDQIGGGNPALAAGAPGAAGAGTRPNPLVARSFTSSNSPVVRVESGKQIFSIGDIRSNRTLNRWKQGDFLKDEIDLLKKEGVNMDKNFKGSIKELHDEKVCDNEIDKELNTKCQPIRVLYYYLYLLVLKSLHSEDKSVVKLSASPPSSRSTSPTPGTRPPQAGATAPRVAAQPGNSNLNV